MDISDCLDRDFPIAQWLERWNVKARDFGFDSRLGQSDNFSLVQIFEIMNIVARARPSIVRVGPGLATPPGASCIKV